MRTNYPSVSIIKYVALWSPWIKSENGLTWEQPQLSVIGDPSTEEDRVVHLLASLPDSYNVLVTALEANADVPNMEVVTERLLHEERKTWTVVHQDMTVRKWWQWDENSMVDQSVTTVRN